MKKPAKAEMTGAERRKEGQQWIARVQAQTKREKDWMDAADYAVSAYTNEANTNAEIQSNGYDYNMAYANVETIVPAIINSQPMPDIRRRFGDRDEPARVLADVLERAIRVQTDDNKLQIELEGAAQDAFLAGRGIVRLRFYSDIVGGEVSKDDLEDLAEGELVEGSDDEPREVEDEYEDHTSGVIADAAAPKKAPPPERVENENCKPEVVSWRDFRYGKAKRWDEVPWIAFRFCVPKEDENAEFNPAMISGQLNDNEKTARYSEDASDITGWEIWCKKSRKVYFVDDDGVMLKEVEDPLGLTTGLGKWFPICTPLQPIEVTGRLTPVNPFSIYRKLADEMDDITKRIRRIVKAMKVKGWYAGSQKDLEGVKDLDDDEFAPIQDAEMWAQNGGLEGAIAFWPVERFVVVLKELYAAREQTKAAIYEITGISDIVRGASVASETATAQNIKSQWGSLRIQKMQRMIERAARDLFVMMAEMIATKFTPETLEQMTGIPLIPRPDDAPEQLQMKMQVMQLMKTNVARLYRIDVESDSTIRADLTRQKQEVAEFLQGAASYFQAVAPLVQQGALPADAAVDIFASTARMFNLGKSVEDTLEKMVVDAKQKASQPPPEKPDPEQMKLQADAQRFEMQAKAEADKSMREFDLRRQELDQKAAIEREKHNAAMQKAGIDIQKAEIDLEKARVDLQRAMAAAAAPPKMPTQPTTVAA